VTLSPEPAARALVTLTAVACLLGVAHADEWSAAASVSVEPMAGPAGESAVPAPVPAPEDPADAADTADAVERPPAQPDAKPRPAVSRRPRPAAVKDRGTGRLEKREDTVLGGKHWRIRTAHGAVHVWIPPNYERETAGTVVYVHGYWTDADGAWRKHHLAQQFKASRQNAMFIVPDAPSNNDERVKWPALTDLRKAVTRANIRLPDGPIVVVGHSGAFRTVMQWVDHRHIDQIILLDAMYSGERKFDEFIKTGKYADRHKLIVVAASTAASSKSFANKYRFAVAREKVPASYDGFSARERRAKLLYVHSQYDHMGIVTSKKVIPVLLRLTRLKAL